MMTEIAQQQRQQGGPPDSDRHHLGAAKGGTTPPSPAGNVLAVESLTARRRSPSPIRQLVGFRKLGAMWHPHVYQTPTASPTPFSIDDILNAK